MISINGSWQAAAGTSYSAGISNAVGPNLEVFGRFRGKSVPISVKWIADGSEFTITVKLPKGKKGFLRLYVNDGSGNGTAHSTVAVR